MISENVARILTYGSVLLACAVFSITYAACFPFIKKTTESWHLLIFTAVIGGISGEILISHLDWMEFSLTRFLILIGVAAVMLWQRVYLLWKNLAWPLLKRWALQRIGASRRVH